MNLICPRTQTSYITIIRNPVSTWESAFAYFKFAKGLGINKKRDPINFFLENLASRAKFNRLLIRTQHDEKNLPQNPMFFDLGLERKLFENSTMISRAIKLLEKDFNLILVTDHFDELMVLLKRRLCWNIEDVAYLMLHVRKPLKHRVRT